MSLLRELFGPGHAEVWREVAESVHGEYIPGSLFRGDYVQVRTPNGIITLDLYTVSTGKSSVTYTRLRAPFVNRMGQRLKVYRAGFFSEFGKMLGAQDIELGDPVFDGEFMVQGRSPEWVKAVVDPAARRLIQGHDQFCLEVRPEFQLFGPTYPSGVELLVFHVTGVIKDAATLCSLFQILDHVLRRIETVAQSHLDPGARQIAILSGPGGWFTENDVLIWDGASPRCHAANELGRLQDRRALPELMKALNDSDPSLRRVAAVALGRIGAPEAVPALLPLLGIEPRMPSGSLSDDAAQSISMLGESSLVAAFRLACAGELQDVAPITSYRAGFVAALTAALSSGDPPTLAGAAATLAQLGAVEALQALRDRYRKLDRDDTATRTALNGAIDKLEDTTRLPRPASSPGADAAVLPLPAAAQDPGGTQDLPRPASGPNPFP